MRASLPLVPDHPTGSAAGSAGMRRVWARLLLPAATTAALVYLMSAAVGALVAYEPEPARLRFATLAAGLAVCAALWQAGAARRWRVLAALSVAAGPLALGLGIWSRFAQPHMAAALAETIAILLPLQAGGAALAYRQGRRLTAELLGAGLLLNGWLLILSGERSVWLAAAIGLTSAILVAEGAMARPHATGWRWARRAGAGIAAAAGLLYLLLLVWPPAATAVPGLGDSELAQRAALWRDMIRLAADYRFTGSGLGMTAMVASSYLFLLHVPLYDHAHNLYIQMALEQGVFGVMGFGGMALATLGMAQKVAGAGDPSRRVLGACALATLVTLLVHGLLDAELYASVLLPLLFLPFGLVWGLYAAARQETADAGQPARGLAGAGAGITAVLLWAVLLWAALGGRGAWAANQGALAQTRAELRVYRWPQWVLQDQVRRSAAVNLEPALAYYQAALDLAPSNVTAQRRLGQIALARGEAATARRYLSAAYALAPHDRVVRQLLGESDALAGNLPAAVHLWQGIDLGEGQLDVRLAWYAFLGNMHDRQQMQEAINLYERGSALP